MANKYASPDTSYIIIAYILMYVKATITNDIQFYIRTIPVRTKKSKSNFGSLLLTRQSHNQCDLEINFVTKICKSRSNLFSV